MMDVLINRTTGAVENPGPGFSAEGLALEWDAANQSIDEQGVMTMAERPFDIVPIEQRDAHPAMVALRQREAEEVAARPVVPTINELLIRIEALEAMIVP